MGYVFDVSSNIDMVVDFSYNKGTQDVLENIPPSINPGKVRNESLTLRAGIRL